MFEKLLKKIAVGLNEQNIPYMIIGGQAVLLYGEPRLTRDIDITLGLSTENLDLILSIASKIGLTPLVDPQSFVQETMVLPCQDNDTTIRVDFIFSFTPYEQQAIQRARKVKLGDTDIAFASPEDIIIHKIIAGRPRDLEDVKSILLKNPEIDMRYIRRWLRDFSKSLDESFHKRFDRLLKSVQ
jgi:predicted nucleotidyltransferase